MSQIERENTAKAEVLVYLESSGPVVAYLVSFLCAGFGAAMYYDGWKVERGSFHRAGTAVASERTPYYFFELLRVYIRRIYRCVFIVDATHREIIERSKRRARDDASGQTKR